MKILIVANNQKRWKSWDKKIQELKNWFSPALDLDIEIVHKNIKNILYVEYGMFDGFMRYGIDKKWYKENILSKDHDITLFSVNRKDWDCFPVEGWQWDGNSIAIASNEKGSYNFKGVKYPGEKWFNLARHEICHALYTKQGKVDRTHYHWDSGDLSRVLTELVQESIPTLTLTRNQDDGVQTLGELDFMGMKWNTLELSWKNNQRNISCIPKGTYDVKWTFSPKFMKYTYEIQGVPNRSGIRIHTGNYFTQIQGCILVGNGYKDVNGDGRLDVINSKNSIGEIESLLNKKPFKLIIK